MTRIVLGVIMSILCAARSFSEATDAPNELYDAVAALREGLNDAQNGKLFIPFNSDERLNWHYFPKERAGIPFSDLDDAHKEKCLSILRVMLSADGFKKVETIRSLEDVLRAMGSNAAARDLQKYYTAIFGEPAKDKPWALRYEGHHLSLNWTIVDNKIVSSTVQFLGSNPGETMEGPKKGTRPLASEEDLARKLVKSLDEAQRKMAVTSATAPNEIITGAQREVAILEDLGIAYKELNAEQQGLLISLIEVYASVQRPDVARERIAKVRAGGLDGVKFSWMGGLERGEGHYYRIQGAAFLIEYDNTQNNANHIHTVWRDFKGDFGADILKEHYKQHASARVGNQHEH
jgi:hypothetical protein